LAQPSVPPSFPSLRSSDLQWLIPLALGLMMAHKALLLVTGAFRIVNLLLTTSPIGLILTAIALAAGLIIMYWKPISGFFQRIWGAVVAAARWAWFTILRLIFMAIGTFLRLVWNTLLRPAVMAVRFGFVAIGAFFPWLWTLLLQPVVRWF